MDSLPSREEIQAHVRKRLREAGENGALSREIFYELLAGKEGESASFRGIYGAAVKKMSDVVRKGRMLFLGEFAPAEEVEEAEEKAEAEAMPIERPYPQRRHYYTGVTSLRLESAEGTVTWENLKDARVFIVFG